MRILLAFIITTVIYLLLLWIYFTQFNAVKVKKKKNQLEHIIKIDLQKFQYPKKKLLSSKVNHTLVKNKNKKVIKKINNRSQKKRVKDRKVKKSIKKVITKKSKLISESEMIFIEDSLIMNPVKIKKNKREMTPLITYPNLKIKKLYGKSFHSFSEEQKNFITDNLDEIHRITQQTLSLKGYPSGALAGKTGQEGTNIVSFNLHPNGNISDLHLLQTVGYRILDNNTLETIRTAYKDYPYPSEITRIIFYVEYSIFGY